MLSMHDSHLVALENRRNTGAVREWYTYVTVWLSGSVGM